MLEVGPTGESTVAPSTVAPSTETEVPPVPSVFSKFKGFFAPKSPPPTTGGRKSRKQGRSRKQRRSKKQRKTRK